MCGIGGIYSPDGIQSSIAIQISRLLRHRGPDDEGYLCCDFNKNVISFRGEETIKELGNLRLIGENYEKSQLILIHRRLSIIDLKLTGHQPMSYENGEIWIVFNGEIYNYPELKIELKKLGYDFRSDSDTEVILAAYMQWSSECVDHFLGMWSFVIYDLRNNHLFCSRDRFGIKPFYYYENGDGFAFGSEIKVLLSIPYIKSNLEEANAIEFLINGNQNYNGKTLFKEIKELQPGHNLVYDFKEKKTKLTAYYKLKVIYEYSKMNFNEAITEFRNLLNASIKIHLRSDVPIGACLSGGLDSSTIVGKISGQNLPYRLNTFTSSFPGLEIDETSFINRMRERFEFSDHYTYPEPKQLWKDSDLILWHHELPLQSTSPLAQWKVMELSNLNSIKVLLDGQGMDEILGGYSEFVGAYLLGILSKGNILKFIRETRNLRANYKTSKVSNELLRSLFHLLPQSVKSNLYSTQRLGSSVISDKYSDISNSIKFEKRISNSISETSLRSINNILPVLLRYEDRNSMAFSIESRVPFLDHRFVELCVSIPDDFKIYKGWTKYILRECSDKNLPSEIIWRKEKLGFVTPEKRWMNTLYAELNQLPDKCEIPDIIDKQAFLKIVNSDVSNRINLSEVWKIVLFIKWFNIFKLKNN